MPGFCPNCFFPYSPWLQCTEASFIKAREHVQMHVLSVLISVLGYTIQRSTEACVSSCKPLDEGRHAATRVGKSSTAVVHL